VHLSQAPGIEVPGRGVADDVVRFLRKAHAGDEDQFLLTIAYQAGPDQRIQRGADGFRDYFTRRELEKACWSLLSSGAPTVGLFHADGTEGAAQIVESNIHRADPWLITAVDGTRVTVNPGDWLVGMICDDTAWSLYKRGLIAGVSPQGGAKRRRPSLAGAP
jgi:Putative phage serine protease XkdF